MTLRLLGVFFVFVLLSLTGCGNGNIKVYPVSGQVLYNNEPLVGVEIAFHPVDKKNDTGYPPHAKTDEAGNFRLSTFLPNDGAPSGEFKVAIAFSVETVGDDDGSDQTKKILFQIPKKYHQKETTPFTVTVNPEANTLKPFTLEGPPLSRKR